MSKTFVVNTNPIHTDEQIFYYSFFEDAGIPISSLVCSNIIIQANVVGIERGIEYLVYNYGN